MNLSLSTLGRTVFGVALVGSSGLYITRWGTQSKIRGSVTYQEALQCLRENSNAVDILGEPITENRVNVGDNNCWGRKDNVLWVTVPLEGKKRTGNLHYRVIVTDPENEKFQLSTVELSIDGTSLGRILLKDNPAGNGNEMKMATK